MKKEPELIGGGFGTGRTVGAKMGLEGFDVVLGPAAATVDILVECLGPASFQVGDDVTCVGTLVTDFDAGDDALDIAPACRAGPCASCWTLQTALPC